MRTRMVRVRRERPSGVIWAVALMLLSLSVYLFTAAPSVRSALSANQSISSADPTSTPTDLPRVTEEIVFGGVAYYLIQFGAYADAENARIEAARYVKRGAAGYVLHDTMYRVIGAGYDALDDAERVKDKLYQEESMSCVVYPVTANEVTLRVTATQPQIDALAEAQRVLDTKIAELNAMAYEIDSGETTRQLASGKLLSIAGAAETARASLAARTGEHPNDVAAGLIDLLEKLKNAANTLSGVTDESLLSFSSKIKYNTIELRLQHADYLKRLAA